MSHFAEDDFGTLLLTRFLPHGTTTAEVFGADVCTFDGIESTTILLTSIVKSAQPDVLDLGSDSLPCKI